MGLEGENAIARYRELMGPTDSKKAPPGTIRGQYGTDIEKNAVHGSDGPDTAKFELGYFFQGVRAGLGIAVDGSGQADHLTPTHPADWGGG